jgi:predicted nucleotidyltransferase
MPMRPSVVLEMKRSAVREAASRFHAANPRVFGSVRSGADRDGSDLDLLVDALPGATLFAATDACGFVEGQRLVVLGDANQEKWGKPC